MGTGREYIYVSQRKLGAMPGGRRRRRWRLSSIGLDVGPVGAEVARAEPGPADLGERVRSAEKDIRSRTTVLACDDRSARAGRWIEGRALPMVYGVPEEDGGAAAVFLGDAGAVKVFLCGSAEHLLDRSAPVVDPGRNMSAPEAVGAFLRRVQDGRGRSARIRTGSDPWFRIGYPIANIRGELDRVMQPQPVDFLARVIGVVDDQGQGQYHVLATPLHVAHA